MVTLLKEHTQIEPKLIFSGNALFTIFNELTGNHFTYRVKLSDDGNVFFVSVLTNPDIYEFIGFIKVGGIFKHSTKSGIKSDAKSVISFDWIFRNMNRLPNHVKILNRGKCMRCGRKLTTPNSILSGIGPECLKRLME